MQDKLLAIKSFSLVCTTPCEKEAALLIFSIRRAGYDCPILMVCDDTTDAYLRQFKFLNVIRRAEANPSQLITANVEKKNSFHKPGIILKKMDAVAWAVADCGNTMFLDSDIVFLKPLDGITHPTMLSPTYSGQPSRDKYGGFNAGYLYTEDFELADRWRWLYLNRSRFYEQECISLLFENFDCGKFSKHHNVGFWRDADFSAELVVSVHQHFDPAAYTDAHTKLGKAYDHKRMGWMGKLQNKN